MILDSITLENFAIYGGRHQVPLTPRENNRPIVLFGGLNGGGKTTLLDGIQLAFYGAKARCSNRGKLAYRDYLRSAIHRSADPGEGACITLRFRRIVEGETKTYQMERRWREGARGIEEAVAVTTDGEPDAVLSQHWDEYIENYIPSGISHLFFFDAEQIKELAEGEHAAELLGTAIHSLLGLDLVDRLDSNLVALERRKRANRKVGEEARKLAHAEEELARLERTQEDATHEKAHLRTAITALEREIEVCEARFRAEGGELFNRRKDLEKELGMLQEQLGFEEKLLRSFADGAAPLLLIKPSIQAVEQQARREEKIRKAEILLAELQERDDQVLTSLNEAKLPTKVQDQVGAILEQDRTTRSGYISEPRYLGANEELPTQIQHLQDAILRPLWAQISDSAEGTERLREQVRRAELTLARVPDREAIAKTQRELQTLQIRLKAKQAEVDAHEGKFQVIVRQRIAAAEAVKRLLEAEAERSFEEEDNERVLKHSPKVRATLAKFRASVVRKHAARIERLMLESFTQLLRKSSLVIGLKIDPETFRIELTGGDGKPLPMDRLSAGERQLLATSLLWGLARASGRPIPTIIDTPLGRLDSSHRRHLIERYFPVASHQVILLSTDEEIDEGSLIQLQPYISHSYELQYDEALKSTCIKEGYFWKHEAAC